MTTVPLARAAEALIALSDERDLWLRRIQDAAQRGYDRGREDGYASGWAAAQDDMAAAWHAMADPVARPEAYRREVAARCLAAAGSGCRRNAAEHERAFVARAWNTRADQRTDVQRATVQLYPPPGRRASAA